MHQGWNESNFVFTKGNTSLALRKEMKEEERRKEGELTLPALKGEDS